VDGCCTGQQANGNNKNNQEESIWFLICVSNLTYSLYIPTLGCLWLRLLSLKFSFVACLTECFSLSFFYYKIENLKIRICAIVWIFWKLTHIPFDIHPDLLFVDVSLWKYIKLNYVRNQRKCLSICSGGIWFEPWWGYRPARLKLLFGFTYFPRTNDGFKQVTTISVLMFASSSSSSSSSSYPFRLKLCYIFWKPTDNFVQALTFMNGRIIYYSV